MLRFLCASKQRAGRGTRAVRLFNSGVGWLCPHRRSFGVKCLSFTAQSAHGASWDRGAWRRAPGLSAAGRVGPAVRPPGRRLAFEALSCAAPGSGVCGKQSNCL